MLNAEWMTFCVKIEWKWRHGIFHTIFFDDEGCPAIKSIFTRSNSPKNNESFKGNPLARCVHMEKAVKRDWARVTCCHKDIGSAIHYYYYSFNDSGRMADRLMNQRVRLNFNCTSTSSSSWSSFILGSVFIILCLTGISIGQINKCVRQFQSHISAVKNVKSRFYGFKRIYSDWTYNLFVINRTLSRLITS